MLFARLPGDVFRLVIFIQPIFQLYDYATIAENHGPLVVSRRPRLREELARLGVEEIARKPFVSVVLEQSLFKNLHARIVEMLKRRCQ